MKKRIVKLAIRNSLRNKRRSILAIISIVAAMLMVILMQGFLGGIMDGLVKNTTRNSTGHIRITGGEFEKRLKFMPIEENFKDGSTLIKSIEKSSLGENIKLITERITFPVLLE